MHFNVVVVVCKRASRLDTMKLLFPTHIWKSKNVFGAKTFFFWESEKSHRHFLIPTNVYIGKVFFFFAFLQSLFD